MGSILLLHSLTQKDTIAVYASLSSKLQKPIKHYVICWHSDSYRFCKVSRCYALDTIKVLCEQTRELTDDLSNFLDYV